MITLPENSTTDKFIDLSWSADASITITYNLVYQNLTLAPSWITYDSLTWIFEISAPDVAMDETHDLCA